MAFLHCVCEDEPYNLIAEQRTWSKCGTDTSSPLYESLGECLSYLTVRMLLRTHDRHVSFDLYELADGF